MSRTPIYGTGNSQKNLHDSRIAEEIVQHLTSLGGSNVEVTLEIRADVPGGVPDQAVRTVMENCRTLKCKDYRFEMSDMAVNR